MELPRIVFDELLHQLDEPRERHVEEVLRLAGARAIGDSRPESPGSTASSDSLRPDERTPLKAVAPADYAPRRSYERGAVDARAVDAILDAEEHLAKHADAALSTSEIVKQEAMLLLKMSVPLMVSGLLDICPDLTVSSMAGHVSAEQGTLLMAAYSLISLFQALIIDGISNGLGAAVDTYCSHAYGAGNFRELWLTCQAALVVYMATIPVTAALLLNGRTIFTALGQDEAIAEVAGDLMVMLIVALPFEFTFTVLKSSLQAQNVTTPFTAASLLGWIVGCSTVYALLFHSSIGYMAIAFGNPVFWCVKLLVLVPVVLRNELFRGHWPGWRFSEARRRIPKLLRLGSSGFLMVTFQMLGFVSISLLAGLLPNADIMMSANSIFVSLLSISFMPLVGLCVAGAIRVGNALGSGTPRRARLVARVAVASSVLVALVVLVVNLLIAPGFSRAFTSNPDATREATNVIRKVMFVVPIIGFQLGFQALYRACGRQLLCGQLNFVCLFVTGIPIGLAFAIKWDAGIPGLWYGHTVGLVLFCAISAWWWNRIDWRAEAHAAKHDTRVHEIF